jgi:hypothetical protein
MDYREYSIVVGERAPGCWRAEIRRTDGAMIRVAGTENAVEAIATSEDESTFDAALQKAREMIEADDML